MLLVILPSMLETRVFAQQEVSRVVRSDTTKLVHKTLVVAEGTRNEVIKDVDGNRQIQLLCGEGHAYDSTLGQMVEQKGITNFSSVLEAYLNRRHIGLPDLQVGLFSRPEVIPARFVYLTVDSIWNRDNYYSVLNSLEATSNTNHVRRYIDNDTSWSKP